MDYHNSDEEYIISKNNLTLCQADYFQTCWCLLNSSKPLTCVYLLNHVTSLSNSSYLCVYHKIRKTIECFNSSYIFPNSHVSNIYIHLTLILFVSGLIGNGISTIILLSTKLRRFNVYRNLTILCVLNILYLSAVLIRDRNNYHQDLRNLSTEFCRFHMFTVAFLGHLCSWQLVSTSIQRVHALLSLQSHRTTSWIRTWSILFGCIILPLFVFDGQILFNYGLANKNRVCNDPTDFIKQFRRAIKYPIHHSKLLENIPPQYHITWIPNEYNRIDKGYVCVLWNTTDAFLYTIIPFIIILICSFIIIIKVCQRRRSTVIFGGIRHINRDVISPNDHLSTLLITINILFFLMTSPLNIFLIIQSIFECIFFTSMSIRSLNFCDEYLRLLQNSYHALSFIFYCVIGNKFRSSAKSICRTMYYKFVETGLTDRCAQTPLISCCLDRRRSSSSGQTISTNSRLSDARRLPIEQGRISLLPSNAVRRPTYVTFDITRKTVIHTTTAF